MTQKKKKIIGFKITFKILKKIKFKIIILKT